MNRPQIASQEQEISERILDLYGESLKYLPFEYIVRERLFLLDELQDLHFKPNYPGGPLRALVKKVFQKLSFPMLDRQVQFNAIVCDLLTHTSAAVGDLERGLRETSVKPDAAKAAPPGKERGVDSGLRFVDPIRVGFREEGDAYWAGTTGRIVEKAFVLQALARLYPTTHLSLLVIGAADSLLPYELASLGYPVTAADSRPFGLSHPNLRFVQGDSHRSVFEPESFDCAVSLSTLGRAASGDSGNGPDGDTDGRIVQQMHRLLKPGGHLLLTTVEGRVCDEECLRRSAAPFEVVSSAYGVRRDDFTITVTDGLDTPWPGQSSEEPPQEAVAMLICRKPGAAD